MWGRRHQWITLVLFLVAVPVLTRVFPRSWPAIAILWGVALVVFVYGTLMKYLDVKRRQTESGE